VRAPTARLLRLADYDGAVALGAVGLTSAAGESVYATRLVELEHTVAALLAENRRLRQELRELEAKLDPDAADRKI